MARALLATLLVSSLTLILAVQPATPPATPAATPEAELDPHQLPTRPEPLSGSCDQLLPYQEDLYATFDSHSLFMGFWANGTDSEAQHMDDDELLEIIADGEAMIEGLRALAAPAVYAEAHEGIIERFDFEIDYLGFLGIDASIAPNIDRVTASLQLLYDGEVLAAETCPDEIEEAGGYIFVDPAVLEDAVNP